MSQATVFSGSTKNCLVHYGDTLPKGNKQAVIARKRLCDMTGASDSTVRRWVNGQLDPIGLNLIRVRYFLNFLGYKVEELQELRPDVFVLGALVSWGMITVEQCMQFLDLNSTAGFMSILRGQRNMSDAKYSRLASLLSGLLNIQATAQKLKRCGVDPEVLNGSATSREAALQPKAGEVTTSSVTTSNEILLYMLLSHLEAAKPLAELLLGDSFDREDRRWLRQKMDGDGLYKLSQMLNALCSDAARQEFLKS